MDPLIWGIILLLIGLALIVLELFVPSGGILGILSAAAILGGIVIAFTGGPRSGVIVLVAALVVVPSLIGFALKVWPDTPIGRLILIPLPDDESDVLPDSDYLRKLKKLVGQSGRVKTPMLPSGLVDINGEAYDATSNGMSFDVGQYVEVVAIRNNRIVVKPTNRPDTDRARVNEPVIDPLAQPVEQFGIEPLDDPLA